MASLVYYKKLLVRVLPASMTHKPNTQLKRNPKEKSPSKKTYEGGIRD